MLSGKNNLAEPPKSWKKINEERKALKKKRKQEKILKSLEQEAQLVQQAAEDLLKSKNKKENPSTVSIAVPGSILENAQSPELCTYVAGQIARAACIFRVDEVIVFDDINVATARETKRNFDADEEGQAATVRSSSLKLGRILQYLECPQYLRKFFFPLHKDLKYSGLLNPLDAPHHLRQQNTFQYREGIVTEKKAKPGHSYVNVGLLNDVLIDKAIEPGVRVTVKLDKPNESSKKQRGKPVSPEEPRRETGAYWGYNVRIAHNLKEIFTHSPYDNGYDLTIGTSDRGKSVHDVPNKSFEYNHLLIVFGGLKGLEAALANDDELNVDDPSCLFHQYINVLPRQGSRTIRTEEAALIALAALEEKLLPKVPDIEEDLSQLIARSEDTGIVQTAFVKQKKIKSQGNVQELPTENSNNMHNEFEVKEITSKKQKREKQKMNVSTDPEAPHVPKKLKKDKSFINPFIDRNSKHDSRIETEIVDDIVDDNALEVVSTNHFLAGPSHTTDRDLSRFD